LMDMTARFAKLLLLLKPKRRWLQFSLGTMLLAVTLLCVWLADYVSPVRKLERQLSDADGEVRESAAERLGYMGSDARSTTNSLLLVAKDDTSSPVRVKAVWALSRVSGCTDLRTFLQDSDADVCQAAVEGMLWRGDDPSELVLTLLEFSHQSSDGNSIFETLGAKQVDSIFEALGPKQAAVVIPVLLDLLPTASDDPPNRPRDPVIRAINHMAFPDASVGPALIERLHHEEPEVRTAAAEQLLRLGELAREAAPALRTLLHDRDPACAVACAAALGAIDPDDKEFLSVLKEALHSNDDMLALRADAYLWMLGPRAAEIADDLAAFLCDLQRDVGAPHYNLNAVKRIGPAAITALDRTLQQAIEDHERALPSSEAAQRQLSDIGFRCKWELQRALVELQYAPDGKRATTDLADAPLGTTVRLVKVCFLKRALKMASMVARPESRFMVPAWLGVLGPPAREAVPTLIRALDDRNYEFQFFACQGLGMLGKDAAPAVPRLLTFLDLENPMLRDCAFSAIERIGVCDETARSRLRHFLASNNPGQRARAARILAASGEPVDEVLPLLIESAIDPDLSLVSHGSVRWECVASIAALGRAAVPELILRLQERDRSVRSVAAEALGKIGPGASAAVPYLIQLLDDANLGEAAVTALGEIGPAARAAVPKLIEMLVALQTPPKASDDDLDGQVADTYHRSGHDARVYTPILRALVGIGVDARDAAPAVLRLANSDDTEVRHLAILTLARIDPDHRSLMRHMRRWLGEWERRPSTDNVSFTLDYDPSPKEFADAVWELGPRAESLTPDLNRIMLTAPLVHVQVRCYAAFAVARFPSHRQVAEDYLQAIRRASFSNSFETINLAESLLQQIGGNEQIWTHLAPAGDLGP
jgi:HEAT repeat protein